MKWKSTEVTIFVCRFAPRVGMTFALLAVFAGLTMIPALAQASAAATSGGQAWHDTLPGQTISARVSDGVLTVDGMVGKIDLNYDMDHTGFLYFYEPGVGTAVVSLSPLAGAVKVPDGIDGNTLAFTVEGHSFELSNAKPLLSRRKNKAKADIYVRLDAATASIDRYPKMGYGNTTQPPYVWPLSLPEPASNVRYVVTPPPMPSNVLPRTVDTALEIPSGGH
ncbi:MAG: hypothetical protein ACP5E5_08825 [Acidobacteriaceae bacterium]